MKGHRRWRADRRSRRLGNPRGRWLLAVGIAIAGLAACTAEVTGSGRPAASFASSPPPPSTFAPPTSSAPSSRSPSSPATPTSTPVSPGLPACPRIIDTDARLSYACITSGMTASFGATIWTVEVTKQVDTNWVLNESSAPISPSAGGDVSATSMLLTDLLVQTDYGDNPTAATESSTDTTIGAGVPAHLVQTLITLDPTYAATARLKVRKERLWVLVAQLDATRRSAFMISVPDVVGQLWPSVPALIKGIKVT